MQSVTPYREETYPPSGPQWPQFGEHGLSHSLSVTEEARQHLVQKRQEMLPMHQERLDYHRMTPAFSMAKDQGVPTVEAPRETMEQGMQASEGVPTVQAPRETMEQGMQASESSSSAGTRSRRAFTSRK